MRSLPKAPALAALGAATAASARHSLLLDALDMVGGLVLEECTTPTTTLTPRTLWFWPTAVVTAEEALPAQAPARLSTAAQHSPAQLLQPALLALRATTMAAAEGAATAGVVMEGEAAGGAAAVVTAVGAVGAEGEQQVGF